MSAKSSPILHTKQDRLFADDKIIGIINKYSLKYSIDEFKDLISELGINDDSLSIENIRAKAGEKRSEFKFCLLFHSLNNFIQSTSEQIISILTEAKIVLEKQNKIELAKSIEWVLFKIKNEEIYDLDFTSSGKTDLTHKNSIFADYDSKIFEEYSADVFNQTKRESIMAVRKQHSFRNTLDRKQSLNLDSVSPSNTNKYLKRNSLFSANSLKSKRRVSNSSIEMIMEEKKENYSNISEILSEDEYENGGSEVNESNKDISTFNVGILEENKTLNHEISEFIGDERDNILNPFDDRDFPIFEYNTTISHESENILNHISQYIFNKYRLFPLINESRFEIFLSKVKCGYDNFLPYHNHIHAADVLQTCNIYAIKSNFQHEMDLTDLDMCGYFISAIIHDYRHPGLNNAYQINKRTTLANKYNDISVLENFHVSAAFKTISENNSNIFVDLTIEEYRVIRKRIIECVLATDIAKHAKNHHSLKLKIKNTTTDKGLLSSLVAINDEESKFDRQQDILNFFLHCSDISNPTKKNDIYLKWTDLVIKEFHIQGDLERKENLPISFLCDRNNFNLPKSQIGFITNILFPCFSLLVMLAPKLNYSLKNLDDNLKKWQELDK